MKQTILNLWEENDQPKANYDVGNEIIDNTEVLKLNLCDYNDAYVLVRDDVIVSAAPTTQHFNFFLSHLCRVVPNF